MISESTPRRCFLGAALAAGLLAVQAPPARAEDPLLGRIKVIKCVGCEPGSVNLIVHDPIDVRDFEVQIKESDYQKIITPLAGKTIYDKEGCFYWMELPKGAKAAGGDAAKKQAGSKKAAAPDSLQAAGGDPAVPAAADAPQGTPSKCIPYLKIEPKPGHSGSGKDKE
jgi:hypothetical protein